VTGVKCKPDLACLGAMEANCWRHERAATPKNCLSKLPGGVEEEGDHGGERIKEPERERAVRASEKIMRAGESG